MKKGWVLFLVLGLVLLLSAYSYWESRRCCKVDDRTVYFNGINNILLDYHIKNHSFPQTLKDIAPKLQKDFWEHEVKYIIEPQLVIIISPGADGEFGTDDDASYIRNFKNN